MSKIVQVNLSEVMPKCYIDYAIDVIGDRALPDIRDGLKPVHRRILYDLNELKVVPEKGYRKSARIVGDVLGKYHPHGDQSVYNAMVRLAQPWSMRYMLVDGHGNFGSIDGDSPASMRYTEVKQQKIMQEMVRDINKNTVDFIPNFDREEEEPSVLPSRFPNLLVNGSYGIAVGFATNLAPHNLGEVIDGIIYQIDNSHCTTKELMQFIKAPDFPTGTNIINPEDLEQIYTDGYGKIITRATHHLETIALDSKGKKQRECIVFTDVPYQVTKTRLITTIDEKIRDTKKVIKGEEKVVKAIIPEIESVTDESDRNGIRIVVIPKKQADIQTILHKLYKYTPIQNNFNVNNTVLINNFPCENVPLKFLITHYILHQQDILKRRTTFDKTQAEKSLHILLGIQKAIDKLDLTIKTIKESSNKKEAKENLINTLQIDESQAEAILQMQLQRLTNLEKDNVINQIDKLQISIQEYTNILCDPQALNDVLKNELLEIKDKYSDERRTKIIYNAITNIDTNLLIEQYSTIIQLTNEGYIKKIRATSTRGKSKDKLKEGDFLIKEITGDNRDTLILFSNKGNAYKILANDLKDLKCSELGEVIANLIELENGERIINIVSTSFNKNESLVEIFENGNVARIEIESYNKAIKKLNKCYDQIPINIQNITNDTNILLVSQEGKALIIDTSQIRPTKSRNTQGVSGMKIDTEINKVIDSIIGVTVEDNFDIKTEKGKSKFIMLDDIAPNGKQSMTEYLKGNRNTQGNFIYNTRQKHDKVIELVRQEK